MELLVLGGTSFVGRHLVAAALHGGHRVTLFNRGRTNPELFPEARHLGGDRTEGDYRSLAGEGPFDAVVDTCAYFPRHVREALQALDGRLGRYVFISSMSVYGDPAPGVTEEAPVGRLSEADAGTEEVTSTTYGPLKVACEETAEELLPGKVLVVRPGLVVGPHDPTDRFTYWVRRMAEGGEVLAPDGPEQAGTQFIDARDLGAFVVLSAESGTCGVFNAVGPRRRLADVLDAARRMSGSDASVNWVPWSFLQEQGVEPWTDLPAWLPDHLAGHLHGDAGKATAAGLAARPLDDVVADIAAWDRTRTAVFGGHPRAPGGEPLRAGLSREREAEVLRNWRERREGARPPGP